MLKIGNNSKFFVFFHGFSDRGWLLYTKMPGNWRTTVQNLTFQITERVLCNRFWTHKMCSWCVQLYLNIKIEHIKNTFYVWNVKFWIVVLQFPGIFVYNNHPLSEKPWKKTKIELLPILSMKSSSDYFIGTHPEHHPMCSPIFAV